MREMEAAREKEDRQIHDQRNSPLRKDFERINISEDRQGGYPPQANKFAPAPPERKSSYDVYRTSSSTNIPTSTYNNDPSQASRTMGSSAMRQSEMSGGGAKKTVSFDSNLETEIRVSRSKESTSSESSYINYQSNMQSPEDGPSRPNYPYRGSTGEPPVSQYPMQSGSQPPPPMAGGHLPASTNHLYQNQGPPPPQSLNQTPPPPSQQSHPMYQAPSSRYQQQPDYQPGRQSYPPNTLPYQNGGQNGGPHYQGPPNPSSQYQQNQGYSGSQNITSPYSHGGGVGGERYEKRTPENAPNPTLIVTENTPGVVGANEVYRDPRDRMLATKQGGGKNKAGENLSFKDKMKMFASEIGENTPPERNRSSRVQQRLDSQLKSP